MQERLYMKSLLVFRRFYVWNVREVYYISYIVPKHSITKKRDVINILLALVFSVRTVNFGPLFFAFDLSKGKTRAVIYSMARP